jgi:hypothetical protein
MKPADKMKIKEIKDVLFRHYQWPPSTMPKGRERLVALLRKMRRLHPKVGY